MVAKPLKEECYLDLSASVQSCIDIEDSNQNSRGIHKATLQSDKAQYYVIDFISFRETGDQDRTNKSK